MNIKARLSATAAVDIGGTKIAVGLIDPQGKILARAETPTAARDGFAAAMGRIDALLHELSQQVMTRLDGIGIGCTGPVNPDCGEIGEVDFLPGWEGCNPVNYLAERFEVTAAMENDADAAALAEKQYGAGRGTHSLVYVSIGTGIGGGIVLNNQLYRGTGGAHPEIGHHVIEETGPPCFCGANGCWEVLARGPAMVERFARQFPHGGSEYPHASAADICALARRGERAAQEEIAREARYLAVGIANLVTLFAPDIIVLGGSVMKSADLFLPTISERVRESCRLIPRDGVRVVTSALGHEAALIGAAVVWSSRQGSLRERST